MKITEIYQQHRINKGLQEHMVRVAAVAKLIGDHTELEFDRERTVAGCLLHDLGNLLKVKFNLSPELFEPEGVAYWRGVQQEMSEKYSWNVHDATIAMMKEANVDPQVITIVDNASFSGLMKTAESGTLEEKVLEYADMRVSMHSIVPTAERFADIRARYVPDRHKAEYVDSMESATMSIEKELFAQTSISPADITEASSVDVQTELYNFEITTT